jgi:hypothetical protein
VSSTFLEQQISASGLRWGRGSCTGRRLSPVVVFFVSIIKIVDVRHSAKLIVLVRPKMSLISSVPATVRLLLRLGVLVAILCQLKYGVLYLNLRSQEHFQ